MPCQAQGWEGPSKTSAGRGKIIQDTEKTACYDIDVEVEEPLKGGVAFQAPPG